MKYMIKRLESLCIVGVFINGEQHNVFEKDSFVVEVQFKFKQVPMAKGHNFTRKFWFNSSNGYKYDWGTSELAKIEVSFIFAFFIKLNLHLESFEPTKWISD